MTVPTWYRKNPVTPASDELEIVGHQRAGIDVLERQDMEAVERDHRVGHRELLRIIAEKGPGSLDELAQITGRAKSNLSRTLKLDGCHPCLVNGLLTLSLGDSANETFAAPLSFTGHRSV